MDSGATWLPRGGGQLGSTLGKRAVRCSRRGSHWDRRYGAYGNVPIVRTYEQKVAVVRIELIDPRDRQVVWSGSGEALAGKDQAAQADAIRAAIRSALDGYPPY